MADALTTLTKLIQSPPGQLVAGGVLAGIVWKFFERVEAVLTDQTKLEIANWLRGVKTADHVPWPETFAAMFDRVFGTKQFSWRCIWRSSVVSICSGLIGFVMFVLLLQDTWNLSTAVPTVIDFVKDLAISTDFKDKSLLEFQKQYSFQIGLFEVFAGIVQFNILPAFISLFETRLVLKLMKRTTSSRMWLLLVGLDGVLTVGTAVVWNLVLLRPEVDGSTLLGAGDDGLMSLWCVYPALFTSIWLWLYAGSGFILKAARHFDIGFQLFNRKFDIEKKPLQSIGLVAGALVAVLYWSAVIVSRVVK